MKVKTLYRVDIKSPETIACSGYYDQHIDPPLITPTHQFDIDSSEGKCFNLDMKKLTNEKSIIDNNGIVHIKLKKRITPYTLIEIVSPSGSVLREIQYAPRLNVDFKLLYTLHKGKVRLRYLVYFGKKASKQTFPQENFQPFQLKGLLRADTNGLIFNVVQSEMEIDSFASKVLHPSMDTVVSHVKKSGKKFNVTEYVKKTYGSLIVRVYKGDFTCNQDFENWVHTKYPKITFTTLPKVYKRNGTVNKAGLAKALRTMVFSIEGKKRGTSTYTKAISEVLEGKN